MCCSETRVVLCGEINEGKEKMATKKYRDEVGASVASTLRLTEDYAGTQRTVIADSRFGSCSCLEWLWDRHHLHSIMAVKTAHKGYPKTVLREKLGTVRGNSACMKVKAVLDRGETEYYASAVLDKKPMYVVSTCGTSIITHVAMRGPKDNPIEVRFPEMNALYRKHFNGIDLFNRDCLGPRSVQMAVKSKSWYRRFFLAILGMCETNA
jgi:hypothetical protein